ncbi:motility associated factor glycosyltransferase family protein [Campylobacter sp. IFREMER_LSEM_CL1846]|uniref:motility associated factor glycosyltransferase family protein n=1 Tax=unclassified Campylobacter TaxID=2593542 RepID=UPI0012853242|nr:MULTISPECIES: motility associated factor glycosyltransferase family protein [unclassified Campylobacter]EAJ5678813.1 motility associated factor glycosyltransferase family protein [Campylobacter lari]EAK0445239.1 motility associated factor glycosyltransferase family protein [Campylobacter lari]EAK9943856.1 motility associated factor glycosyltransferase family protein [Campylobacter lari]MCV3434944.1 motility associated factor glycosyltransferase family protein [Campylobacter sp. IFREMER_LSEM_
MLQKNIKSIKTKLSETLSAIKKSKYKIIQGNDSLDINFLNTQDNTLIYKNPLDELNAMLKIYNEKYRLYPVLYFYGFGNGILYKALLQNPHHKIIIVFEKDLEIIHSAFSVMDFSKELQEARLVIADTNLLKITDYELICKQQPMLNFARTYFLELHSDYYERYHNDVLIVNNNMLEHLKKNILRYGNLPFDALQGIEQFTYNLPKMLTHPNYKELLQKRKNLSDTAIIVSTGPSLSKQLPLLKQYASKATIFCTDSAYPILAKHNIKPDYVISLERVKLTSKFFNNNFGNFDKDIIFILKSYTHPDTIKYLDNNNRNYLLVSSTGASFIYFIQLHSYGYLVTGWSVANMASNLAFNLGHKNIILIGQDLAYSNTGHSHSSGHIYPINNKIYKQDYGKYECKAYGGKGKVQSSFVWNLFRQNFESDIVRFNQYNVIVYNCTEGGARIAGAIEKPFKQICEKLLTKELKKPFTSLENPTLNKQNELMLKAHTKIKKSILHCQNLNKIFKEQLTNLKQSYQNIQTQEDLNIIVKYIDEIKSSIENKSNIQELYEILYPLLMQFEFNLAKIYVLNPINEDDTHNKSLLWIKEHIDWLELIIAHIDTHEQILHKNILPLQETIIQRGYGHKIK